MFRVGDFPGEINDPGTPTSHRVEQSLPKSMEIWYSYSNKKIMIKHRILVYPIIRQTLFCRGTLTVRQMRQTDLQEQQNPSFAPVPAGPKMRGRVSTELSNRFFWQSSTVTKAVGFVRVVFWIGFPWVSSSCLWFVEKILGVVGFSRGRFAAPHPLGQISSSN